MIKLEITELKSLSQKAAVAILRHFKSGGSIMLKSDQSPVTLADIESSQILVDGLQKLFPEIPVLSEENISDQAISTQAGTYWLVDPLDGTKEFIAESPEFAICMGLIVDHKAMWGLIHAPALNLLYWGGPETGSFMEFKNTIMPLPYTPSNRKEFFLKEKVVLALSRSHPDSMLSHYQKFWPQTENLYLGSALKFGAIAEGRADLYFKSGPIHQWDVAAGHAILKGCGKNISHMGVETEVEYFMSDLKMPRFEAF